LKKLSQRLRDRCEVVKFTGCKLELAGAVQSLIAKVWKAELGRDDPPDAALLGNLLDKEGNLSFRRTLQILAPVVRAGGVVMEKVGADADGVGEVPCEHALFWLIGGALVVAVGALSLAACVWGGGTPEPTGSARGFRSNDLLK
jgi:hypothetical protein